MSSVVNLIDRAPVHVAGQEDMGVWLKTWAEHIAEGRQGELRSIVIVVERMDGTIAKVSQSLAAMNGPVIVGLLHAAAHRILDGNCTLYSDEEGR